MLICLYEDRPTSTVALKITVLSLARHCPDAQVLVQAPHADDAFASWLARHSNATLRTEPAKLDGWNIKPEILLRNLDDHEEVVWLDADVVCVGDWRPLVQSAPPGTLVVTEETIRSQNRGGSHRAVAWGLTPTRSISTTINTCLVRVTRSHIPLLERWQEMMTSPRYVAAQAQPPAARPLHLLGDQEVLTALMSDVEFAGVPLRFLRQGHDVVHCFGPSGYSPAARVRSIAGRHAPPILHAMVQKPWQLSPMEGTLLRKARVFYEHTHARQSPYALGARDYLEALEEPAPWLERVQSGWTTTSLSGAELPLACVDSVVRTTRARLKIQRFAVEGLDVSAASVQSR